MNYRKQINGRQLDLITFDWDGTLMDSAGRIARCIQAAAQDLGAKIPADEDARYVIGLGLENALRIAIPDLPSSRYSEAVERYRHHYMIHGEDIPLFSGVVELIDQLTERGYRLAVATGKSRKGLDRALKGCGLFERFHATRCVDECHSKPHPQMLHELMEHFDIAPESTLMIGDTTHDLLMGKNAGTHTVAVTYGAHPRSALETESPTHCVSSIEELTSWLTQDC